VEELKNGSLNVWLECSSSPGTFVCITDLAPWVASDPSRFTKTRRIDMSVAQNRELEWELESELEGELEGEFEGEEELEGEFEEEFELEGEGELEGEFEEEFELEGEGEFELEGEGEEEGEQFIRRARRLARGVSRIARRAAPILRTVARVAAPMVGTAIAGPIGGMVARQLATQLESEGELEGEFEQEFESEYEGESEAELEAEFMAAAAARVPNGAEAEAMVGAATALIATRTRRRSLHRLLGHLTRGVAVLTRILRRRRATRPLVRAIPTIVRRTVQTVNRRAAAGAPVTRRLVAQAAASQVRQCLSRPAVVARAIQRNARAVRRVSRPATGRVGTRQLGR
jgi:hypothetical protein